MDMPTRRLRLDLLGGFTPQSGPFGRAEVGTRLNQVGLYGYGQVDKYGPQAGLGLRWEVDW